MARPQSTPMPRPNQRAAIQAAANTAPIETSVGPMRRWPRCRSVRRAKQRLPYTIGAAADSRATARAASSRSTVPGRFASIFGTTKSWSASIDRAVCGSTASCSDKGRPLTTAMPKIIAEYAVKRQRSPRVSRPFDAGSGSARETRPRQHADHPCLVLPFDRSPTVVPPRLAGCNGHRNIAPAAAVENSGADRRPENEFQSRRRAPHGVWGRRLIATGAGKLGQFSASVNLNWIAVLSETLRFGDRCSRGNRLFASADNHDFGRIGAAISIAGNRRDQRPGKAQAHRVVCPSPTCKNNRRCPTPQVLAHPAAAFGRFPRRCNKNKWWAGPKLTKGSPCGSWSLQGENRLTCIFARFFPDIDHQRD